MRLVDVADVDDPRLEPYRNVKDPRLLRERGWFLAEGRVVIESLLRAPGFRVHSVLATDAAIGHFQGAEVGLALTAPIYRVAREVMNEVSGLRFHQGCVAAAERTDRPPWDVFAASRRLVLLEQVTDPDNVGGIFRSADAFGIDGVLLSPGCASPLYRKASRTSMGAVFRVPFRKLESWPAPLAKLRETGFELVGLTPEATAQPITDFVPSGEKLGLVFGTEGFGLTAAALRELDASVRIPMRAGADSLNVATAAGIALHRLGGGSDFDA